MNKDKMNVIRKEGDYKCIICECKNETVFFKSQQELQVHTQEHGLWKAKVKPKNVKCDYCPEMFISINNVCRHIFKAHPDKKTGHFCSFCGKYFPLESFRDIHIKFEHNKTKAKETYQCQCGVTFNDKKALDFHIKTFHRNLDQILISDIVIMPASNKIQMMNTGEMSSVYYCHLCGAEYMLKSHLRAHVEKKHADLKHYSTPQQLIKCTLCSGLFFTKLAYDTHNLSHKPDDQYVSSEQERSRIVHRIDGDFDPSRIPTIWDSLSRIGKKPRIKVIECLEDKTANKEDSVKEKNLVIQSSKPPINGQNKKKRRNKALVDSDEEVKSDTSDDDDDDIETETIEKEDIEKEKKGIDKELTEKEEMEAVEKEKNGKANKEKETMSERSNKNGIEYAEDLDSVYKDSCNNHNLKPNSSFKKHQRSLSDNFSKRRLDEQCIEITPVMLENQKLPEKIKLDNMKESDSSFNVLNVNVKGINGDTKKDETTACDNTNANAKKKSKLVEKSQGKDENKSKSILGDNAILMKESKRPRRSTRKRFDYEI